MGRVDRRALAAGLCAGGLLLIAFTNALGVLCFGALLGAAACGAHAVTHEAPPAFEAEKS
jgi:hypothetical protein